MMAGSGSACISQSMLIAALPAIMRQFEVDATLGQLLTTSYIFTLGLISALSAFLVRRVRTKPLFLAAMSSFLVGCVAALLAPDYWTLLAARLLQAGGAGVTLPLIQVVALSLYPKSQYGKAMGLVGLIIGFAPAIGPTISGLLIDQFGWHSVFVALVCVAAPVIVASVLLMPGGIVERSGEKPSFDAASFAQYTVGFCACMAGVTVAEALGIFEPACWVLLAFGAAVLAVFARRQLRAPNPFLKLLCFRNPVFAVSAVLVVLAHVAFMSGSIMVPLFVQDVQMRSAALSGMIILPGAVLLGFLNPVTGKVLDRVGPMPLVAVGGVVITAGTFAFSVLDPAASEVWVTVLYGLRVVGVACLMMPMTAYGCAALPKEDLAQATAILTSFRQIFGSMASSVLIAVMAAASSNEIGVDAAGFEASFALQAAVMAVGAAACFVLLAKLGGRRAGRRED